LSALSAGVSSGVGGAFGDLSELDAPQKLGALAVRSAASNAMTQGVAIATGLQKSFNWRSVASAAAGSAVGNAVGDALGSTKAFEGLGAFGGKFAAGTVAGFAGGLATAALRGGKVSVTQVATDAFGNALGDSLAAANGQSSYSTPQADPLTLAMEVAPGSNADWVLDSSDAASSNGRSGYSYTGSEDGIIAMAQRAANRQASANWYASGGMPAGAPPTSYTAQAGDGPLAIADGIDPTNRYAIAALIAGSGQASYSASANRWITTAGQTYNGDLSGLSADQIAQLDQAGRQMTSTESSIDSRRVALRQAQAAQAASNTYAGVGAGRGVVNYNADDYAAYQNVGYDQRLMATSDAYIARSQAETAASQRGLAIAIASGGGAGVPMFVDDPYMAAGLGNPVVAGVARSIAGATMRAVDIGTAVIENPGQAAVGVGKKIANFGPEAYNLVMEVMPITGLINTISRSLTGEAPYHVTPLFTYDNDAQIGGAFLGDLAIGYSAARFGNYTVGLRASTPGTLYSNPLPFELRAPGAAPVDAGARTVVERFDTVPQGQRLILRPIEIEFPAAGLSPVKQGRFAAHLAEQEMTLNRLSITRTSDLELNLANYQNVKPQVDAARRLARATLEGSGRGMDAAHRLDSVAGGYIHEFAGFRDPVQQRIGALWRTRVEQIVPGREHRLIPKFD